MMARRLNDGDFSIGWPASAWVKVPPSCWCPGLNRNRLTCQVRETDPIESLPQCAASRASFA